MSEGVNKQTDSIDLAATEIVAALLGLYEYKGEQFFQQRAIAARVLRTHFPGAIQGAADLGRKGGATTAARHGADHYRRMSGSRKTHGGGRPPKVKVTEEVRCQLQEISKLKLQLKEVQELLATRNQQEVSKSHSEGSTLELTSQT